MKLIDKAALVAWAKETYLCENASMIRKVCYKQLLEHLDSLDAKEVDLEKEIETHLKDCLDVKFPTTDIELIKKDVAYTAKKFFELGMSLNNPITATDRGTVEEIIVNLKRVEQDYHIDLTREMEWVRNKVKKGE